MNRKNKNLKNEIIDKIKKIKFKYFNLPVKSQATILSSLLWIISLFIPWIIDKENDIDWNSFNSISWNIWYILIIIYLIPILIILSSSYKEKIKLYTDFNFKNHYVIINSGLIAISFSIISLSFSNWLTTIWQEITYWNWPILSMSSWLVIIFCWFLLRKEFKKTSSEIILEQLNQNREKIKEKNNMELPF